MATKRKVLAQARENSTNAVSVFSPTASTKIKDEAEAEIDCIVVCNNTGNTPTFRIFLDDDGTTYDQSTALYYDVALAANETLQIDTKWPMNNAAGNLAYRSSAANEVTITVFGKDTA